MTRVDNAAAVKALADNVLRMAFLLDGDVIVYAGVEEYNAIRRDANPHYYNNVDMERETFMGYKLVSVRLVSHWHIALLP